MQDNLLDKVTCLIILRALFIFSLLDKGWSVKKVKNTKNTFEIYKSVKK